MPNGLYLSVVHAPVVPHRIRNQERAKPNIWPDVVVQKAAAEEQALNSHASLHSLVSAGSFVRRNPTATTTNHIKTKLKEGQHRWSNICDRIRRQGHSTQGTELPG